MEQLIPDHALLRDYTERGSERAFETLVQRHLNLVYAAALRQLSDAAAAQEVTQDVFICLARKASWLRDEASLAGWLYKTTLLTARQWWRGEFRRQRREQAAMELGATMNEEEDTLLRSLSAVLDEGLMALREADRQALMLRFFEDRSHRDIGALLGTGEDAARKRVDKALHKLTAFFRRRGYAVSASLITMTVLQQAAQAAPAGLVPVVAQIAMQQAGASSLSGLGLLLAKLMGFTNTQIAAACLVVVSMPLGYQWHLQNQLERQQAQLASALAEARAVRDDLAQQAKATALALAQRPPPPAAPVPARANPVRDPALWSEDSLFVQVPKTLLDRIRIPAIGEDGLLMDEMSRALGLDERQIQQANEAITRFTTQYRALETAHTHPTDAHPTSISVSPNRDQKSFICDPFPQEYQQLRTDLKASLEQTMGSSNSEYFWKNITGMAQPERFDDDYGPRGKRYTLIRPEKEQPGGGPYYLGEEYQYANGTWGSAHFGPVANESALPSPLLKGVLAEWKKPPQSP